MAKQVSEILVKLGIQGAEGLDKLKSSFRELEKAIGPTDETIEKARRGIIEFGEASNKSEQLIKGQIAAFKGLQSQAATGGKVYNDLKKDIKELESVIYGANAALEEQRKRLTEFGASSDATAFQIQQTINALIRLRSETRVDSEAFDKFGQSISTLTSKLKAVNQETQNFADAQRRIVRPIGASSAAARQQIRDLELVTEALRDQRDELGALEGEARIRRGVADLAERGAPSAGRLSFEEALAESLLGGQALRKLLPVKDIESALDEVRKQIGDFQREIEVNLSKGIQRSFQETARAGRESARAMAAAFSDPELINVFNRFDDRLGEIPQTATGFSQRLRELQQVFANTARSAENYISVALDIARVQREASATTQGLGAALVRDLNIGVAVRNKKNLQEAIGQLQAEMNELDTQTAEGSRLYAENANQARNLERQLRELGNSYRHVADMATQAATAQASEATARVTANYMNRGMVRAQEQALAELGQRVRAGVAATPLALPAAGQTSAPGTGLEISGGARVGRATGRIQRFFSGFQVGEAQVQLPGRPQAYGPQATEEQADRARRAAISEADAVRTSGEARARAEQQIQSYRAEIDKARRADIGSIQSTERLRNAINQYRSTLPGASAEFKKLTKDLGDLDVRSEKLSRNLGRRRMGGMQMAQAAGAAISGGIFGGPEGFLGGAIGGIAGGVGGAFVGAAAGAQVGMLRQQLGGFADYAAQIQKMQIALKGAAGTQEEFNRAVAAANSVVRNLNVPQDVAIQGMTQLTAAVKGAGGEVSDAELVFKNITSAIKATGGSAQDVDGAITAMVQVFSKGKVSAEELSGQLGERLPGAVTKFAKANDMTLPELQKALEQGQVGLNELMNFIVQLGDEYAGVAGQIASSSQDAGARLTVAFNEMKIAVGEALQPIGAQFQEAFIPFIENITPALVDLLPKIGDFALSVAKNLDVLAAAAGGAALAMGALSIASIKVAGTAGLSLLGVAMMKAASAAGALTVALKASSVAALLNPWVALAAGIAAATVALIKHNQAQQEYNNLLDNGAGSTDELRLKQRELESEITAARKALEGSADGMGATGRQAMQLKMKIAELENQLARINKTFTVRLKLEREGFTFDEKGRTETFTVAGIVYDANGVPIRRADGSPLNGLTDFSSPTSDKAGAGKTKKERESQLPQLMAQLAMQQQIAQINEKIRNAQLAENQFLQIRLEGERELAQIAGEIKAIAFEKIPADEVEVKRKLLMLKADETRANIALKLQQTEKQNLIEITQQSNDLADSYATQIEDRQRLQELIATGMKEALALEYIQIENILEKEKERLEVRKALLQEAGDIGGAKATQDLIDRLGGKEVGLKSLAAAAQPEEKGKLQQFIEQAEAELKDFEALAVRISQNIGNAIGNSIANGVTGLIEGTTTAKEIFANFLRDVGQILIQEGAKMIATYIAIGIARAFAGLQSSTTSSTGPNPGGIPSTGNVTAPSVNGFDTGSIANIAANGAYFDNGTAYFAKGGIVTRPTFFKYAKGGEMQNGLMGEAGPEAIVPLKRGPDGRLGISMYSASRNAVASAEANAGSNAGDYQEELAIGGTSATRRSLAASAAQAVMATRTQVSEQRSISERRSEMRQIQEIVAKPAKINVEFQSQVINNVEYVTRDQAERMAAQSALRGRELAIGSLQNSVKTRKRVGMA